MQENRYEPFEDGYVQYSKYFWDNTLDTLLDPLPKLCSMEIFNKRVDASLGMLFGALPSELV